MNIELLVDELINKKPIYNSSTNIEELVKEKERLDEKLEESYICGQINRKFFEEANKKIEETYGKKIEVLNIEKEKENLRLGKLYIKSLIGIDPTKYELDKENNHSYDIDVERKNTLETLDSQFRLGIIDENELEDKAEKINFLYNKIINNFSLKK